MNDTSLDGINLDADSFSAVTDSIDKVKDYIQQILKSISNLGTEDIEI